MSPRTKQIVQAQTAIHVALKAVYDRSPCRLEPFVDVAVHALLAEMAILLSHMSADEGELLDRIRIINDSLRTVACEMYVKSSRERERERDQQGKCSH